jgi:hypothetical protein
VVEQKQTAQGVLYGRNRPEGEVPTCVGNVCSRGNCGRDVLALSLTGFVAHRDLA